MALLKNIPLNDILLNPQMAVSLEHPPEGQMPLLGAVTMTINGEKAISFDFQFSAEAEHLLPLLYQYEKSSSAKFHMTLKLLLDTYGIREDNFDRVSNEYAYLAAMASAKTDKQKIWQYAKGPTVVIMGPGEGTDFENAEEVKESKGIRRIVGIELSEEAATAARKKIKDHKLSGKVISGNGLQIKTFLNQHQIPAPSTISFISMLHEVFSFSEKDGRRFNLDSVKKLLAASLDALAPGGRLLIRDGVMPEDGETEQILEINGAQNKEVFDSFVKNFEPRRIPYEMVSEDLREGQWKVKMRRKDAMEFLFTLTWCYRPQFDTSSLPYEVREQYGVLTRRGYVDLIKDIAREQGIVVREVQIPNEDRSYLQQGYIDNLKGKARLLDLGGKEVPLPDSNMMIIIEKQGDSVSTTATLAGTSKEAFGHMTVFSAVIAFARLVACQLFKPTVIRKISRMVGAAA